MDNFPTELLPFLDCDAAQTLCAVNREICSRSLLEFVRMFWPFVEPKRELIEGWWLECWCSHLEAVTRGEITRLLGNCPPGFMKSLLTNVFWPAWEWGPRGMPHMRYVSASYSQALTIRDNERMEQVVFSHLYQDLWGHQFSAVENKIKFANDKTGWKFATSVGGIGTGERGDRVIIDDPNNVKDVESETVRASTNQWLTEVMPTRLNDPERSAVVMIQQRSHEEDATGTLLGGKGDTWEHVMVPMRFEPHRARKTMLGWRDPRKKDGELAWPERFSERVVADLEARMGPYATAGQFQQIPTPRGGAIIQRDWWMPWPPVGDEQHWRHTEKRPDGTEKIVEHYPHFECVVASLDPAYGKDDEGDWSAFTLWGIFMERTRPKVMLKWAWRDRLPLHELVEKVINTCVQHHVDSLLVEAKASGISVVQEVRRLMRAEDWQVIESIPRAIK